MENRQATALWRVEFVNSDMWTVDYSHDYEFLPADFRIAPGIVLPTGGYTYQTLGTIYTMGTHRPVSGRVTLRTGSFYGGSKQEANLSVGRIALSARLNIEPGVTLNWVDLPQGDFNTRLFTARTIFTPSPRSLVSALLQYNASDETLSSSVRLRWEYSGGSELFVVYTDNRTTAAAGQASSLVNRSFAVKVTRLFRL